MLNVGKGGRAQNLILASAKDFDEPYYKAAPRLGGALSQANTPLGCAYGKTLERLLRRDEPRKMLWIISDGDPGFKMGEPFDVTKSHDDLVLMGRLYRKCKFYGVETFGIMVGKSTMLDRYVDKVVLVKNTRDLPKKILENLRQVMCGKN